MTTSSQRQRARHEAWLLELTAIPTAAGREGRVIEWIESWVAQRKHLTLNRDEAGNLLITRPPGSSDGGSATHRPLFITAHLDHPAFVVRKMINERTVELEFRGGVHAPYFENARIEIFDRADVAHAATITELNEKSNPFKIVTAALDQEAPGLRKGDVGRWRLSGKLPRIEKGRLHTHACDDLAAVAAALATLDVIGRRNTTRHVGLLFTRAEEVGFIGTLAACRDRSLPEDARLICLENSRSFAESPIGGGPILRVGDKISVFDPRLTNRIGALLDKYGSKLPGGRWQRKLMPGGSCEATAFSVYGYESTCICLPLGNYHNMQDIDGVLAGKSPAKVGPEIIAIDDFHGMIGLLVLCATRLDSARLPDMQTKLDKLFTERQRVLAE